MQMCSPKQTVGRVHKQERSRPDITCHVVPVTTFTLNKMDFNKMFGLDGQQYKVWYKAVRALQAQLKKNDRDEDTGVLGMEHMGMLQEALRSPPPLPQPRHVEALALPSEIPPLQGPFC